ncbi:MAG: hypothetical protein IPM81_18880 [Saprospirales bacterium]|nr:hypothetical protein [Saprospirales bacterium]
MQEENLVAGIRLRSTPGTPAGQPGFSLLAPPAADLDQYRNGPFDNPINICTNWVNGNAGEQNSHYIEGWSIPYRCVMTNLPLNTSITLTLGYDIKNGGKHAIDYLTYFHRMTPHDIFCGNAHVVQECVTPATGAFSTFLIPAPSSAGSPVAGMPTNSFNALPAGERRMRLYGGIIDTIYYGTQGSLGANQAETTIKVVFRATSADAVLAWGGHIASRLDWGLNNSASGISGSPYHMRLISWTLNGLGQQDRSLSGGAVAPFCNILGADSLCTGATQQYCVANQSGINYTWSVESGDAAILGSNTGNCVNIQAGTTNFTLKVVLTSNNGLCSDCTLSVVVLGTGTCSIDGPAQVCPGASTQHCAPPGASSYAWSISGAGSISGPDNQQCVTVTAHADCNSNYTLSLFVGNAFCGSICSRSVTVQDITPPAITCPGDVTVSCASEAPAVNTAAVTTSDNCGATPAVTHAGDIPSGACPAVVTRTYEAQDACGNTKRCAQTITVDDKTPPAITCPGDVTVSCASEAPAVNTAAVTTSDNCGATPAVTHAGDIPSGACPAVVTRTYEAQDACGNTKRCAQTITVDDKTPPAITCPGDVTVSCASEAPAVNTAAVTTSDNCGATPAVTHAGDIPSGACPAAVVTPPPARPVTYLRSPGRLRKRKRCAQTITVDDKTPPAITCPRRRDRLLRQRGARREYRRCHHLG